MRHAFVWYKYMRYEYLVFRFISGTLIAQPHELSIAVLF